MSKEEWRAVVGHEGAYEVSDQGRVRSLDRTVKRGQGAMRLSGRALRPSAGSHGYLKVQISGETHLIHRLVLEAFVGPCPEGMECLHGDGDPTNNTVENLRWGTRSENMQDQREHGTNVNSSKTHCPEGHPLSGANLYVRPSDGGRECRVCRANRSAAWWRKQKMKKAVAA